MAGDSRNEDQGGAPHRGLRLDALDAGGGGEAGHDRLELQQTVRGGRTGRVGPPDGEGLFGVMGVVRG